MIWNGSSLVDGPVTVAHVDGETLILGEQQLRVVSENHTDMRAVDPDGALYRARKVGLTVSRYRAECAGRAYSVNRTGAGTRREILAQPGGQIVGRTRGCPDGSLVLEPQGTAGIDLVFISWAMTYVDAPTRRTLT